MLNSAQLKLLMLVFISVFASYSCDTGFGEPCTLPEGDAVQQACSSPPVENGDDSGTSQSASATCALDNFPGCSTFLCLKYRGSSPYCSLRCESDAQCDGGKCCPLVGDCGGNASAPSNPAPMMSVDPAMPAAANNTCANEDCYCIRTGDLGR